MKLLFGKHDAGKYGWSIEWPERRGRSGSLSVQGYVGIGRKYDTYDVADSGWIIFHLGWWWTLILTNKGIRR